MIPIKTGKHEPKLEPLQIHTLPPRTRRALPLFRYPTPRYRPRRRRDPRRCRRPSRSVALVVVVVAAREVKDPVVVGTVVNPDPPSDPDPVPLCVANATAPLPYPYP